MEQANVASTRISTWLAHKGLNANAAAQLLGYANSSKMYKLLQGTSPGFETLVELLTVWPDLNPDWLLLGKGPMSRPAEAQSAAFPGTLIEVTLPNPTPPAQPKPAQLGGRVITITVDKDGNENTSLVTVPAQAGYAQQHNEAVFLRQLRHYRIPGFESGTYRAFEVAGDSMEPTLNHRDIVVGSIVEELRLLEPGEVYVVVTPESVMLKRIKDRVRASDTEVLLHSDNPHRKPFGLETRDIMQLWRVRGYVSSYLPSAPDISIERLWEVIDQLGLDRGEVRRHLAEDATADATLP